MTPPRPQQDRGPRRGTPHRSRRALAVRSTAILLLAPLAALAGSCGGERASEPIGDPGSDGPPPPPSPGALVMLDDRVVVREQDFAPLDAFWAEHDQTLGVKFRRRQLFEQILLPIAVAREAFPEQRAAALQRATAFAAACGNSIELRRRGAALGGFGPEEAFSQVELPGALLPWLTDPAHIGAASPPLETPEGYYVCGLEDIRPGVTSTGDRIVAFLVPFPTHPSAEFDDLMTARRESLRGKLSYVAPGFAEYLPDWTTGN